MIREITIDNDKWMEGITDVGLALGDKAKTIFSKHRMEGSSNVSGH